MTRRAQFGLRRSERRVHIVEGLLKAQEQLDLVVKAIRKAPDGPAAAQTLQTSFGLSAEQVDKTAKQLGMSSFKLLVVVLGHYVSGGPGVGLNHKP